MATSIVRSSSAVAQVLKHSPLFMFPRDRDVTAHDLWTAVIAAGNLVFYDGALFRDVEVAVGSALWLLEDAPVRATPEWTTFAA